MSKADDRNPTTERPQSLPGSGAHDSHGTPFTRVPGPGPKDAGKGAAGKDAVERIEGGFDRVEAQQDDDEQDREAAVELEMERKAALPVALPRGPR